MEHKPEFSAMKDEGCIAAMGCLALVTLAVLAVSIPLIIKLWKWAML